MRRAIAAHQAGRLGEADRFYRAVLAAKPDQFDALHLLGVIASQRGQYAEADRLIGQALAVNPNVPGAHYNRGNALQELKQPQNALASYDKALALKPDYAEAWYNRGNCLAALGRPADAVASFDRALAGLSALAEGWNNRGNALKALERPQDALASYDRAIAIRPDYAEAHYNRGTVLEGLAGLEQALACYDRALAIRPDFADALNNRGSALLVLKRQAEAAACFTRLVEVAPDYDYAVGKWHHALLHCNDWTRHAEATARVAAAVAQGRRAALPFSFMAASDSPAAQLECARILAADKYPASPTPLWTGQRYDHDRIRIAYLSADFRDHPVAILIVGVLERHDRARFETIGISLAPEEQGAMGRRIKAACDRFVDVTRMADREVAVVLRAMEVDIAIDLTGYTHGNRTGILAHRPAPIQVNYLGFPGTMGAGYIDYIVADRHVAPAEHRPCYAESVVHLPDMYQANDAKRAIAAAAPSRADAGLPDKGFVFCCFNRNYKIMPGMFDRWMRLLARVDGSVLWLLEANDTATANLRREAERRGVAPQRLVFAARVRPDEHLARHRLADLFLDTLPYNAHTTASDALWAGLPILTCMGGAFPGRVAASLLRAAGLPELIASGLDDYDALAFRLATEPGLLAGLRARLARNRATCALFDTDRMRRHLESAYTTMWRRHQAGAEPADFAVDAIAGKTGSEGGSGPS
ncbi:MAG: tetratricopeptide repeat protein [Alphaproteobacteria bacterium]|nr:tetratricopeptide repeat protein [Alphaproteobacteria bacterium]